MPSPARSVDPLIDNHAAMVNFIRAYDEMRECQLRHLLMALNHPYRNVARQRMEAAEDIVDALRRRFVLAEDEPDDAPITNTVVR